MEQNTGDIDWVEAALAALHRITGIQGRIRRIRRASRGESAEGAAPASAAAVGLRHGDVSHRLAVVCRRAVRTSADLSVVHAQIMAPQAAPQGLPHGMHPGGHSHDAGLLITTYLTPALAVQCREMGLQFIDTAGNAYLDAAGMFVFVCGQTPPGSLVRPPMRTTGNPSSQRMVFALLSRPALLQATYREIAHLSGIALGSVGAVFNGLAARGWLLETRTEAPAEGGETRPEARTEGRAEEKRRLTAPDRLLDEWVANFPTILRPRLQPRRFAASAADWWQALPPEDLAALDACWGSEVAALAMGAATDLAGLVEQRQTIYMQPARMGQGTQALASRYRLKPQPNGPIEILEAFWDPAIEDPARPGLAPPVLVYADLMASLQPRNLEVAAELRNGVIRDALDQF
ncbi:type IV toxin-antitoxin system AbiEi family antitoxin [Cupriavidus plantarum]|uniref:type IV toxin-antitoxin system AbiEi family antitoxin n=1 Tax=Cupriavidus plantarum TaxID=942865 RepID=UPI000E283FEF|nr:type IV toxin-antitoxin system AbiEi family antitoxin [Cupriavidus plantarum]REE91214.1 hypothetical protein C7418_4517 [Cupriavidus plantarum]